VNIFSLTTENIMKNLKVSNIYTHNESEKESERVSEWEKDKTESESAVLARVTEWLFEEREKKLQMEKILLLPSSVNSPQTYTHAYVYRD
jgi:hypothetical protein